ncbi:MAG: hypothetical protein KME26_11410 [Oscillatoria princeps RMCB-10]|jgi:hypothetical protein|nr:hypothetical protein [Oscillatoria princeps RMCB-10]
MMQNSVPSVSVTAVHSHSLTNLGNLQDRMLAAKTIGELHALIVDYTDIEMNQAYSELTPEQQHRINLICQEEMPV